MSSAVMARMMGWPVAPRRGLNAEDVFRIVGASRLVRIVVVVFIDEAGQFLLGELQELGDLLEVLDGGLLGVIQASVDFEALDLALDGF